MSGTNVASPQQQFVDIHQLTKMLGCSRTTIRRWVREGRFPAPLRLSQRFIRWDVATVQRYLAELAEN